MLNYVNTVLVSNLSTGAVATYAQATANTGSMATPSTHAGKFVVMNCDPDAAANGIFNVTSSNAGSVQTIKVGIITKKNNRITLPGGTTEYRPIIKWSNEIKAADIKSYSFLDWTDWSSKTIEDTVAINFRSLDSNVLAEYAKGGKRIIIRLTYKDMPHRYRKWTESYEYVTAVGDTVNTIVKNIVNMINKEWKRARIQASLGTASAGSNAGDPDTIAATASGSESGANTVILTALPYDDDDSVDSLSWTNKVRFNANLYWTDPAGEGWEANNKHFPKGVVITKTPGEEYPATAKRVRDRESWAMGYQGILNRGEGTWPIIKPDMETDLNNNYDGITLEFENMYRAADDIQRKTKQTLEIYGVDGQLTGIKAILDAFVAGIQQDEIKDNIA